MPSTSNKSQFSPAQYRDGRAYVHNQHSSQTCGLSHMTQCCYRCKKVTTSLGGKRHPVLGLLCKFCVEEGK
jgi:hypothetical protein